MTILTAPDNSDDHEFTVFLAGGISNCPDWQTPAAEKIQAALGDSILIVNPRRNGWDMNSHVEESTKQILWEHKYLKQSAHILFWFPKETLCPITLLELGKYLVKPVALTIGTHPEYQRRLDVEVQSSLEGEHEIWDNLDDMVDAFIQQRLDYIESGTSMFG